jgi:hypothetical protein
LAAFIFIFFAVWDMELPAPKPQRFLYRMQHYQCPAKAYGCFHIPYAKTNHINSVHIGYLFFYIHQLYSLHVPILKPAETLSFSRRVIACSTMSSLIRVPATSVCIFAMDCWVCQGWSSQQD